jgi:NAD(P)-dependent dehydrogenase (short-subunit alcohol dehydrogenase family)
LDTGLKGKVAVVTGSGMPLENLADIGNGSAIAVALAREGCCLALIDLDADAARRTKDLVEKEGGTAFTYKGDVSEGESVEEIASWIVDDLGAPSVLVNNVGVSRPRGDAVRVDADLWDETMRINVKSMMLTAKWLVPHMEAAGGGSIVNIASISGLLARIDDDPSQANLAYPTSKGAVLSLTRTMASHHALARIRVNSVVPGTVFSTMVGAAMSPEVREIRRRSTMLKTEGSPWDIANAVVFLAGETARWITGASIVVDGGATAARYTVGRMA